VLALAGRHGVGPDRLEAACATAIAAIAAGDPSYRTVKGILAAGTETAPTQRPTGDGGAAAHLHGPTQLFRTVIPVPTSEGQLELDTATASGDHQDHGDDEDQAADQDQEATP
jgi:hypothetical protein